MTKPLGLFLLLSLAGALVPTRCASDSSEAGSDQELGQEAFEARLADLDKKQATLQEELGLVYEGINKLQPLQKLVQGLEKNLKQYTAKQDEQTKALERLENRAAHLLLDLRAEEKASSEGRGLLKKDQAALRQQHTVLEKALAAVRDDFQQGRAGLEKRLRQLEVHTDAIQQEFQGELQATKNDFQRGQETLGDRLDRLETHNDAIEQELRENLQASEVRLQQWLTRLEQALTETQVSSRGQQEALRKRIGELEASLVERRPGLPEAEAGLQEVRAGLPDNIDLLQTIRLFPGVARTWIAEHRFITGGAVSAVVIGVLCYVYTRPENNEQDAENAAQDNQGWEAL